MLDEKRSQLLTCVLTLYLNILLSFWTIYNIKHIAQYLCS